MFTSFLDGDGIIGRDRLLIQAGTDRPSEMGRVAMFSIFGRNQDINNMALVGYSSSPDKYFYVRPRIIPLPPPTNLPVKAVKGSRPPIKSSRKGGEKQTYKKIRKHTKKHTKRLTHITKKNKSKKMKQIKPRSSTKSNK